MQTDAFGSSSLTIQPFLPIVPAAGVPPVVLLLLNVFRGITALARSLLLALVALVHFVLVELLGAVLVSNSLGAVPMVSMLIMIKDPCSSTGTRCRPARANRDPQTCFTSHRIPLD
jgi:hypothetical protein